MKETRAILMGVGNVGLNVLKILDINNKRNPAARVKIVGVADSKGSVVCENIDIQAIIHSKETYGRISPNKEESNDLLNYDADLLIDCTPASRDGARETDLYRKAFEAGMDVVTANKSGLANRWKEIMESAKSNSRMIRYEATVAGGVPLFSFLDYSIIPSRVKRFRGIVSLTINYIISSLAAGKSYEETVNEAIKIGIAERDPTDDANGLDAARKSVILANHIFAADYTLRDAVYEGVQRGRHYDPNERLVTEVYMDGDRPVASSRIVKLASGDFLLTIGGSGLGYQIETDNNGIINVSDSYDGPYETAGAVVNDVYLMAKNRE